MDAREFTLKNGCVLLVREAVPDDASALISYIKAISGQSDFLSFGRGEFELTESEERVFLDNCRETENKLYIIGLIDTEIVSTLHFAASQRVRLQHAGELGITVHQPLWGKGIGSIMIDMLLDWARTTQVIKKNNLRVRTDNQRAIRLYEKKGFVREGILRKEIFVNGRYFDHYWMGIVV